MNSDRLRKRFSIPCQFGKEKSPFNIYVGDPVRNKHPLRYQANWLKTRRGGEIPLEVMESFAKLHAIAKSSNVSYADLAVYALASADSEKTPIPKVCGEMDKSLSRKFFYPAIAADMPVKGFTLADNFEKSCEIYFKLASFMFPGNCTMENDSRLLMYGMLRHLSEMRKEQASLEDAANLLCVEELDYTLSVDLDASGGNLNIATRALLAEYVLRPKDECEDIVRHMKLRLEPFVFDLPRLEIKYSPAVAH